MSQEIKNAFDYLKRNEGIMTQGQISFVGSLLKWFYKKKSLSSTQAQILFEIANNVKKKCNE